MVEDRHGEHPPNPAEDDELCAMFDESSQCTIVLPVECLGYGLVVYRSSLTGSPFGFE